MEGYSIRGRGVGMCCSFPPAFLSELPLPVQSDITASTVLDCSK